MSIVQCLTTSQRCHQRPESLCAPYRRFDGCQQKKLEKYSTRDDSLIFLLAYPAAVQEAEITLFVRLA